MLYIQQTSVAAYGAQAYEPAVKGNGKKAVIPAQASSAPRSEQVELSDTSRNLNTVRDAIKALPDIRIPMVEAIKEKIKHNGYPIESALYKAVEKMVAGKMI
jgi:hypothetical protein